MLQSSKFGTFKCTVRAPELGWEFTSKWLISGSIWWLSLKFCHVNKHDYHSVHWTKWLLTVKIHSISTRWFNSVLVTSIKRWAASTMKQSVTTLNKYSDYKANDITCRPGHQFVPRRNSHQLDNILLKWIKQFQNFSISVVVEFYFYLKH